MRGDTVTGHTVKHLLTILLSGLVLTAGAAQQATQVEAQEQTAPAPSPWKHNARARTESVP